MRMRRRMIRLHCRVRTRGEGVIRPVRDVETGQARRVLQSHRADAVVLCSIQHGCFRREAAVGGSLGEAGEAEEEAG